MAKRLYVPLDANLFDDPAVQLAGPDATLLFIEGLCFCKRQLTDGAIPGHMIEPLGYRAGVKKPRAAAGRLVDAGLWSEVGGGIVVRGWLGWNDSADERRALIAKRSSAGAKGAAVRWLREANGDG